MHEFFVMSQVVEAIHQEADKRKARGISKVVLEVGDLTFLAEDQVRFAYDVLTKGKITEGSELDIRKVQTEVSCGSCNYRGKVEYANEQLFHVSVPKLQCPRCGGLVKVIRGNECKVTQIRMEVDD